MAKTADDVLAELGFEPWDEYAQFVQGRADDPDVDEGDLSHNGAYKVQGAWRKGNVQVHLERNVSPDTDSDPDVETVTTHPPVFVVSKGDQIVCAVMKRDPEALKAVLSDLG